jgi:integrase
VAPGPVAQAILGHSNLATTQVYARMVVERLRAAIRALVAPRPGATHADGVQAVTPA